MAESTLLSHAICGTFAGRVQLRLLFAAALSYSPLVSFRQVGLFPSYNGYRRRLYRVRAAVGSMGMQQRNLIRTGSTDK
eukprot:3398893-Pleurochrysis_carterae.AAC.2